MAALKEVAEGDTRADSKVCAHLFFRAYARAGPDGQHDAAASAVAHVGDCRREFLGSPIYIQRAGATPMSTISMGSFPAIRHTWPTASTAAHESGRSFFAKCWRRALSKF